MHKPAVNRRSFVLLGATAAVAGAGIPIASAATPTAASAGAPMSVRIVDDKATSATRALFAYLMR